MFCPIKSSKSRKSAHQQIKNNDIVHSNNNGNNNNHHHVDGQQVTNYMSRYVTEEYHSIVDDEISVLPGDVVLFEFSDSNSDGNWSHVICLRTGKRGFVPSEKLSTDPKQNLPAKKKKMPRTIDPTIEHHQHHHLHRTHHHHVNAQPPITMDNIRLQHQHVHEHQPRFGIPHSLQGSSGKQSFGKYNDMMRNFNTPGYYNVGTSVPQYEHYEMEFRPFHRQIYGLYVVTNNFVGREENDLNVRPGEYVTVLNKEDDDWYWVRREYDNAEGFVPSRFICDYEQVKSILNKGNSTVTMKSSNQNDFHTYQNHPHINHRPDKESLPTDQQSSGFQQI